MIQADSSGEEGKREPFEKLADFFMERCREDGRPPSLDDLIAKWPDLEREIRSFYPMLRDMEELGSVEGELLPGRRTFEKLGEYRILRQIGQGGMGCVYEAEEESLGRHVALKVLPAHALRGKTRLQRFRIEARAAAQLEHPNIVPIFGAGEDAGVHYYVMQFIRGQSLDQVIAEVRKLQWPDGAQTSRVTKGISTLEYPISTASLLLRALPSECDEPRTSSPGGTVRDTEGTTARASPAACTTSLSTPSPGSPTHHYSRNVARLGAQAADALAYAHGQGILHRDIKPSNLLLDAEGKIWVTDFGLAKIKGSDDLTLTGDIVGTLAYMAPERFDGWCDPRSDVYSLGLTLYEMLTLRAAFRDSSQQMLMKKIALELPERPRKMNSHLPRDLETIIWKAIDKEPGCRYQSAIQLKEDLERFLDGKPILARRSGPIGRAHRWARRNPLLAGATCGLFALLVAGLAVALALLDKVQYERDEKGEALTKVEKALGDKDRALRRAEGLRLAGDSTRMLASDPALALLLAIEAAERDPEKAAHDALYTALDAIHEKRTLIGHNSAVVAATFSPDGKKVLTAQGARGNMPARLWDAVTGELLFLLQGKRPIQWAVFSPDGSRILTIEMDSIARLWDAETAKELLELPCSPHRLDRSSFSPDGRRLLIPWSGAARIMDVESGKETGRLEIEGAQVRSAEYSPAGRRIVTVSSDQTVRLWDAGSREELVKLDWLVGRNERGSSTGAGKPILSSVESVNFSSDERWLLTTGMHESRVWEVESGNLVRVVTGGARHSRLSPDGKNLLTYTTGDQFAEVRIVDIGSGETRVTLKGHERGITAAVFSPDGAHVATGSHDKTVRLWNLETAETVAVLRGHTEAIHGIEYSPDGRALVTSSSDMTARIWSAESGKKAACLVRKGDSSQVAALSPDGKRLGVTKDFFATGVWELQSGRQLSEFTDLYIPRLSADGRRLVGASRSMKNSAATWDAETGERIALLEGHGDRVLAVDWSGDGGSVATGSADRTAGIWEAARGTLLHRLPHDGPVTAVSFSPDGRLLATLSEKRAFLWDIATSKKMPLEGHEESVSSGTFSPDGTLFVTTSRDYTARVWEVASAKTLAVVKSACGVEPVQFTPDGANLLVYCRSLHPSPVRLLEARTGREILTFTEHGKSTSTALLSPDGGRVLIAGEGAIRLWNTDDGKEVLALEDSTPSREIIFTPDGDRVLAASLAGITIWDASSGKVLARRIADKGSIGELAVDAGGKVALFSLWQDGVSVLDIASGKEIAALKGHSWQVFRLSFSPEGDKVVTASADGTARIWKVSGGDPTVLIGHQDRVYHAAFSLDGRKVVTSSDDKTVRVWDAATGRELAVLPGHTMEVNAAVFSPDGKMLLSYGEDGIPRLWDLETYRETAVLRGHEGGIRSASFSPDGRRVLTAATGSRRSGAGAYGTVDDSTVRIWDAVTGRQMLVIRPERASSAIFSPDGKRILTLCALGDPGRARGGWSAELWDAATGDKVASSSGRDGGGRTSLFSPDGKLIFIGAERGHVLLAETLKETASLDSSQVSSAIFAPDGSTIFLIDAQGEIRGWPIHPLPSARERKPRALTPDEVDSFEIGSADERRSYRTAWETNLSTLDTHLAANALRERREDPGMREHLLRTLRNVVRIAAQGTASEVTVRSLQDSVLDTADLKGSDEELEGVLSELDALVRDYSEECASRQAVTSLVDKLFDERFFVESVVAQVDVDVSLGERLKATAIRMARGRGDTPAYKLNSDSWRIVLKKDGSAEDYARALARAKACYELEPGNSDYVNTLGVAQYRAGRLEEAVATLKRSIEIRQGSKKSPSPLDLAFLAMCQQKLGRAEEARKLLAEARGSSEPEHVHFMDRELSDALEEAAALIGS